MPYTLVCTVLGLVLGWVPLLLHGPIPHKFDVLYVNGALAVWTYYTARVSIGFLVGITTWPERWWLRGPMCGLLAMGSPAIMLVAVPGCGYSCMGWNLTSATVIGALVAGLARVVTGRSHRCDAGRPAAGLVALVLAPALLAPGEARAACNTVPSGSPGVQYYGEIGTVNQPFLVPGNVLQVRRRPCDAGVSFPAGSMPRTLLVIDPKAAGAKPQILIVEPAGGCDPKVVEACERDLDGKADGDVRCVALAPPDYVLDGTTGALALRVPDVEVPGLQMQSGPSPSRSRRAGRRRRAARSRRGAARRRPAPRRRRRGTPASTGCTTPIPRARTPKPTTRSRASRCFRRGTTSAGRASSIRRSARVTVRRSRTRPTRTATS